MAQLPTFASNDPSRVVIFLLSQVGNLGQFFGSLQEVLSFNVTLKRGGADQLLVGGDGNLGLQQGKLDCPYFAKEQGSNCYLWKL